MSGGAGLGAVGAGPSAPCRPAPVAATHLARRCGKSHFMRHCALPQSTRRVTPPQASSGAGRPVIDHPSEVVDTHGDHAGFAQQRHGIG